VKIDGDLGLREEIMQYIHIQAEIFEEMNEKGVQNMRT
jgi:hypothetical protein